jgi:hypothetical protein
MHRPFVGMRALITMMNLKKYFHKKVDIGFIVGTGRCGTTLLARILNAHSSICVPHELQIACEYSGNGRRLREYFDSGETRDWGWSQFYDLIESVCPYRFDQYFDYTDYLRGLRYPQTDAAEFLYGLYCAIARRNKKRLFLEQTPWYGQNLEYLKSLFPAMKVIHIVRDGRDVALSFARSPWWKDDPLANLEQWTQEIVAIRSFGERYEHYVEIKYEDLVLAPRLTLQPVLGLIGVGFESGMIEPENLIDYSHYIKIPVSSESLSDYYNQWNREKNSVFFAGSVFNWKKRNKELFKNLDSKTKITLEYYGYDLD